jgi:hypothetical protein
MMSAVEMINHARKRGKVKWGFSPAANLGGWQHLAGMVETLSWDLSGEQIEIIADDGTVTRVLPRLLQYDCVAVP